LVAEVMIVRVYRINPLQHLLRGLREHGGNPHELVYMSKRSFFIFGLMAKAKHIQDDVYLT